MKGLTPNQVNEMIDWLKAIGEKCGQAAKDELRVGRGAYLEGFSDGAYMALIKLKNILSLNMDMEANQGTVLTKEERQRLMDAAESIAYALIWRQSKMGTVYWDYAMRELMRVANTGEP